MITDILIEEGDFVRKDSVLFVIDQTPYKAAYEIAVANVRSTGEEIGLRRAMSKKDKISQ